jgi:type II secretory pathway component GspD/PulD (secretin)
MTLARVALAISLLATGSAFFPANSPSRAAEIAPAKSRSSLGSVVAELNFDGAPLSKVIDFLRNISGTNLVVDWKTLETAGVQKDTPISLQIRDVTLRKMLQLVLNQASPNAPLSFAVDGNIIQVTTQEALDKQLVTKVYIVDDLVVVPNTNVQAPRINLTSMTGSGGYSSGSGGGNMGGGNFGGGGSNFGGGGGGSNGGLFTDNSSNNSSNQPKETPAQKGQELVDLIKSVIRPNIWAPDGPAQIRYFSGKLIVTAPVSVQEAIGGPVGTSGIRFGM